MYLQTSFSLFILFFVCLFSGECGEVGETIWQQQAGYEIRN